MSDIEVADGRVLVRGETFVTREAGRVIWCKVTVPRGLDPTRGAAEAKEMGAFLLDQVLAPRSPWLGVVIDLCAGPSVLGPVSLRAMESILERTELVRRPLAIVLGTAPRLEEQLSTLVRERAPRFATIAKSRRCALDWMTASR